MDDKNLIKGLVARAIEDINESYTRRTESYVRGQVMMILAKEQEIVELRQEIEKLKQGLRTFTPEAAVSVEL